jgi:hypothetical protein
LRRFESLSAPKQQRITQKDLAEAEDLDFNEEKENWNIYKLNDGTTLKVKLVLQGVRRLQKCDPTGSPIYLIKSTNVVRAVDVPQELKAKPKTSAFKPI